MSADTTPLPRPATAAPIDRRSRRAVPPTSGDRRVAATDRRSSQRFAAEIDVVWSPLAFRGGMLLPRYRQPARTVDLSLTGASVLAPADDSVVLGTLVDVTIADTTGTAIVRRRASSSSPHAVLFGVEFQDDSLLFVVSHLIDDLG